MTLSKPRLLVLCTGNSARSQMAEGLLRHRIGDQYEVFSAGAKPASVRPAARTGALCTEERRLFCCHQAVGGKLAALLPEAVADSQPGSDAVQI